MKRLLVLLPLLLLTLLACQKPPTVIPDIYYQVTYYIDEEVYLQSDYLVGSPLILPTNPTSQELSHGRDGEFIFDGWSTSPSSKVSPVDLIIVSDLSIYAFYHVYERQTLTVKYYVDNVLFYTSEVFEGTTLQLIEPPLKSGYDFVAWSTKKDQLLPYEGNPISRNLSLHAIFQAQQFDNTDFLDIHYALEASFEEGVSEVLGRLTINFTSTVLVEDIYFHLFANSYLPGGSAMSYGEVTQSGELIILGVSDGINSLSYDDSGDARQTLIVHLNDILYPNQQISLIIDYNLIVPRSTNRLGQAGKMVSLTQWHPLLAKYVNNAWNHLQYSINGESDYVESASYDLEVTHPSAYKVASGGIDIVEAGSPYSVTRAHLEHGRIMAFIVSKDFAIESYTTATNVTIRAVYDQSKHYSFLPQMFSEIGEAIDFFSSNIGPFAYHQEFDMVETAVSGFAMEYSGLVQMGSSFNTGWGGYETLVHELGHQWFYSMMGVNSQINAFFDEGFTEFITSWFYHKTNQYYADANWIAQNYPFIGESMLYFDRRPSYVYSNTVYSGTATVLEVVRRKYGEDKIAQFFASIYSGYVHKVIERPDIVKVFENVFGQSAAVDFSSILTTGYKTTYFN
ncbi:MAG: InlB B-repeat-containing protein [Acholeplasmatales bacterium]|jgi:hypothetical protein|nr:InlB B-repeat-containing protein [Acholeplasmatales bacterium]